MRQLLKKITTFLRPKKVRMIIAVIAVVFGMLLAWSTAPSPFIKNIDTEETEYKVSFKAPFTVHFSDSMNEKSVEKAIQTYPRLKGKFIWPNKKTLEYHPEKPLTIGDNYKIIISDNAKNVYGKSLGIETTLNFIVTGAPFVKFVTPSLNTSDNSLSPPVVSPTQPITVMFDRPMQWPETDQIEKLLKIEPKVKGAYRFISTSTFQFIPTQLPMGTRFKLSVPPGILARDGGETEAEKTWEVQTPGPRVIQTTPHLQEEAVSVNEPIVIHFNQPVELNQIKPGVNILLFPSNDLEVSKQKEHDGFFNTEVVYGKNEQGKTDKSILIFSPAFSYQYDKDHLFVIKAGLSGGGDSPKLEKDFELPFKTGPKPGVVDFKLPAETGEGFKITFATPMEKEMIEKYLNLSPKVKAMPEIKITEEGLQASIIYSSLDIGSYTFELKEGIKDKAGNVFEEAFKKTFKQNARSSSLKWKSKKEWDFFMKETDPEFIVKTKNVSRLYIRSCQIPEGYFVQENENQDWMKYACNADPFVFNIHSGDQEALLNLGAIMKRKWSPGIYHLSITDENLQKISRLFFVSDTVLVLKKAKNSMLVWVTDIKTGQPVADMELTFFSYDGKELGYGKTDKNGIFMSEEDRGEGIYVLGKKNSEGENRWAIINEYESDYFNNNFIADHNINSFDQEIRLFLETDKNVLASGETLNIKGILRLREKEGVRIADIPELVVALEDKEGENQLIKKVSIRRNGSFDTSFVLPVGLSSGGYFLTTYHKEKRINQIPITIKNTDSSFEIQWINPDNEYIDGDIPELNFQAVHFAGIPASHLKGAWELYRRPYKYNHQKEDRYYSFSESCSSEACDSNSEEFVAADEFVFDEHGQAKIIPSDSENNLLNAKYEYRFVLRSWEMTGEEISKTIYFKIHPAEYYIGVSLKHYLLRHDEKADISIVGIKPGGDLIENGKITLSTIQMLGGIENKTWHSEDVSLSGGEAKMSLPISTKMPIGTYKLKAESESYQGNKALAELEFYVLDKKNSPISSQLSVFSDQSEYFPGGRAELMINAPSASTENQINALVTYEQGELLGYESIILKAPLTPVKIQIDETMIPQMNVSVVVADNHSKKLGNLMQEQERRRQTSEYRQMEVESMLMKEELKLMNEKEENDKTKINRLKKEMTSLEKAMKVLTPKNPEEEVDLEREKINLEQVSIPVLIGKRDHEININMAIHPADPNPGEQVKINFNTYDYQNRPISSMITVNVIEIEEGKTSFHSDPLDYFYSPGMLSVETASNFDFSTKKLNESVVSIKNKEDKKRSSAYFNPLVLTNKNGQGEITFVLPKEDKKWQINTIATHEKNYFGALKHPLNTKRRLRITPITPTFVMPGDQLTLEAQVDNLSGENLQTAIELLVNDIEQKEGMRKNLNIKKGQSETIKWNLNIDSLKGDRDELKIAFRSRENYKNVYLPVKMPYLFKSLNANKAIQEGETKVRISESALPGIGGLKMLISALPTSILEAYASVALEEEDISTEKVITKLIVDSTIKKMEPQYFSEQKIFNQNSINERIKEASSKLKNSQRIDGGIAFWKTSEKSDYWLTAYNLFALSLQGNEEGEREKMKQSMIHFLWEGLKNDKLALQNRSFILWALSEVGEYDTGQALEAFKSREENPLAERAFLLMTIQNLVEAGQKSISPFLKRLQSELVSEQIKDDQYLYFEEKEESGINSNNRTTAIVLMALSRLSDENPLLIPVVKYITSLNIASSDRLNSQEAVWLILALAQFIEGRENENANYILKTEINGETILDYSVVTDSVRKVHGGYLQASSLKAPGEMNEVMIEKEGTGDLYIHSDFKYYLDSSDIPAVEKGALIQRAYYELDDSLLKEKVSEMETGHLYKGRLTIVIPKDMTHVTVESPLPAGVRALSFGPTIENESWQYQKEELAEFQGLTWIENPVWHFENRIIKTDRLMLQAEDLPEGIYEIDYLVQAAIPGRYNHLPASIRQLYQSSAYARTEGGWMEIR